MREEIIKIEDGIIWSKFHLSAGERLRRIGMLIPDLLLPRFWDGEKDTYGPLIERLDTFIYDLKAGALGYRILCQPTKEAYERAMKEEES